MDPPPYQSFFSDPPESPPDWDKMEAEARAEVAANPTRKLTRVAENIACAAAKPVDPWPEMPEVTHDPALVKKSASEKDNASDQASDGDKKKPGAGKSHVGPEMTTEEGRLAAAQMPPDAQK
ncbi:hypothetical protein CPLU01_03328 [Colletotrichum plurivorum]|uniref:Uncharacterized protein n=1 Tax=Colletotrichum plurivorum TaxID=2175906 RepID=A0A8H6KSN1_9PEZI|nr:hypothetical protein CPLU01_03328 [Colletotrichum plurivorum]